MGFNVSGYNPKLTAEAVLSSLDIKDGKEDGHIDNSIWSQFADVAGVNRRNPFKTKGFVFIMIKRCLENAAPEVLNKICDFLGWGKSKEDVQEKAQKNVDDADALINEMITEPSNIQIEDMELSGNGWTRDNGYTLSKRAILSDGKFVTIYYNNQCEIGAISISTHTSESEEKRDKDVGEVAIYNNGDAYFDADEHVNRYYEIGLTGLNDEFAKYEQLARQIFGDLP